MEVLFLTKWYPNETNPIFGVYIREHAKAVANYANVTVLHIAGIDPALKQNWELRQEENQALTQGLPTYRLVYRRPRVPKTGTIHCIRHLQRAFQQLSGEGRDFHIIHANVYNTALAGVLLGKRFGLPVVISEHATAFARGKIRGLERQKIKLAFAHADRVCPVSKALQKHIEAAGIHANFHVVPNVVDTHHFIPIATPATKTAQKRLLLVALLTPVKGVDYLLKALAALKEKRSDFVLDIVGDGPNREEYEQLTQHLNLQNQVHFHGLKRKEEVVQFMQQCDIFVLPSLLETFGVVYIEAMACGKPVLAAAIDGPSELITEQTGRLIPPADVDALAKALDDMLDHYQDYDATHIARYARMQYGHEAVGKRFFDIYQTLIM